MNEFTEIEFYESGSGSSPFVKWFNSLKDINAKAIIASRLDRLKLGNWGDCKYLGNGLHELRIAFGPGYRVYFTRKNGKVVIILAGGHKGTQGRDIEKCLKILKKEFGGQK
ncbi:MAG: type II toxin-antitoxin system RelE/ParE family toxin [Nitrospinae bacterium]|nr:type II toxin-antitoxin system RelE/ParE family toxin [Nitrospinota bacterium]